MEKYYQTLFEELEGWTIQGLFNGKRSISDIETIQTGSKGRVFFFDQEPMVRSLDKELWDHVFQEPTIFANSELNSVDKAYVQSHYSNFVDWYYFSHAILANEWFGSQLKTSANYYNLSEYKKYFLFDCNLITNNRQYRLFFIKQLIEKDLINYSYYSFNPDLNWTDNVKQNNFFNLTEKDFNILDRLKKNSYDNFGKSKHDREIINNSVPLSTVLPIDHLKETFLYVVLETCCIENKKHLTEKIFKPIAAGKPFILIGGYKNLEYIRNTGFETFGDLWDESYDNILDPKERICKIIDLLEWFCCLDFNHKIDLIYRANEIALRNWKRFWKKQAMYHETERAIQNLNQAKLEYYRRFRSSVTQ